MPRIGTTNNPAVDTNVVTTPTIDNFVTGAADTEVSFTFVALTKRFTIKNRTSGLIKITYTATESGTKYFSIEPGTTYDESEIGSASLTIYLQSPVAAQTLEIISWR